MFENYSQTYASGVTIIAGWVVLLLAHYHVSIGGDEVAFILGNTLNLGGIVWNLWHRYTKGDLTALGARKAA